MIINSKNKQVFKIGLFVFIAILTLGIGYAAISNISLVINSTRAAVAVNQENFNVHFVSAENITGTNGVSGTATYDGINAEFDVTGLTKVGDYAIAKYTVRNDSAAIGTEITIDLTSTNTEFFKVTETIDDNKLQAGEETYATIRVEMIKTPIVDDVTTTVEAKLKASPIENATATGGSNLSKQLPTAFEMDSWATIKLNIQNNNTSQYNIGDTKNVTINENDYQVRIANKTTGEHCGEEDIEYSQTACGFVVEFVEIIEHKPMRNTNTTEGGYPAANILYDYLKTTLYEQLPDDLQTAIIPTRVISGYGKNNTDSSNFTTIDKLYLLSGVELYGSDDNDTSAGTTHQLEYYKNNGVTFNVSSYSGTNLNKVIKKYDNSSEFYFLRSPHSESTYAYRAVTKDGYLGHTDTAYRMGVSPAFRIG